VYLRRKPRQPGGRRPIGSDQVPKLWAETMDTHRRQVHDAILDATAELIAERGPMSVAMSAVAGRAGIGRATLYKYFPDVESILVAWHERDFGGHLERLRTLSEAEDLTLAQVVEFVCGQRHHHHPHAEHPHASHGEVLGALAHTIVGASGTPPAAIEREVLSLLAQLVTRLVERNQVRADVAPDEVAQWLLHTSHAPHELEDEVVTRLVIDSLTPEPTRVRRR
jgi:AcrR family transcriptional regulator